MKYIAKYKNGYHGCEDIYFVIADNEDQVVAFMQEGIYDYAARYEWVVRMGWAGNETLEENWYNSQDYEDYLNDCYFDIWEATKDDIINWNIKESDWIDIT